MTSYMILQVVCGLVAICLILVALRFLCRKGTLLPWMRGNLGVASVLLAVAFASFAIDLRGYGQWQEEQTVGEISFVEFEPDVYIARLERSGQPDRSFQLHGTQWHLDARFISWRGFMSEIGLKPVFRFDRLSARHLNLSANQGEEKYVYELGKSEYSVDTWKLLHKTQTFIPWMMPQYEAGVSLPMAHQARYQLVYTTDGLEARPSNTQATAAADGWL